MNPSLFSRAVAHTTGESITTIRRRGFNLVVPVAIDDDLDDLPQPQAVNWDQLDAERPGFLP